MRIKRKDANVVKICEASQVEVKTAGDTTVIQFCAGQNKKCPVQNLLSSGQKSFKYITIVEPQGENHGNSWHLHIILVFEDVAPFIANDVIVDIWSKGFTDTHAVFEGDGLALYFKAYLSDVEYEDDRVDLDM